MKNDIIAIIGPSGSGKDTIMKKVIEKTNKVKRIVSYTTRPKREHEIDGEDYHFITQEQFLKYIEEDKFVTFTCFNTWLYGVLEDDLETDKTNIGVFSIKDIYNMLDYASEKEDFKITIYLVETTDKERLMRQLAREYSPNIDEIIRRYEADKKDFQPHYMDFPVIRIENNTREDFVDAVHTIINVNSL